jgi:sugar lactone lactonase YvrE
VVFSYDTNQGVTRSGALTIAGQTLTVTQAGANYVAARPLTTLVSSNLISPGNVAVDSAGSVYIADTGNSAVKKWVVGNNTVTTLVSSNLSIPGSVAVDGAGNIYIADTLHQAIKEWTASNGEVITLVTNLIQPEGVAVDGAGNVYIANTGNSAIKEWTAANSNVTTLASASSGLVNPYDVAVDGAGNVYIADTGNNAIKEWTAANSNLTTLVSNGLSSPQGVAVDGAGNVYIADTGDNSIKEWVAANNAVTELVSIPSGLSGPQGVAVDGAGNVYIADTGNNAIRELPYAFVDPSPRTETSALGIDTLPQVLPPSENLLPPFAPVSDQSWLTINSIIDGDLELVFTPNSGASRTAHITLLGQTITVTQQERLVFLSAPTLTDVQRVGQGVLHFTFTNNPSASFTVLSATNLGLPLSDWTVVGTATNIGIGSQTFEFTTPPSPTDTQRFYTVRTPSP